MTDSTQPPAACEHGIRAPWQCHDCDAANPPPPGYDPLAPTQPPADMQLRIAALAFVEDVQRELLSKDENLVAFPMASMGRLLALLDPKAPRPTVLESTNSIAPLVKRCRQVADAFGGRAALATLLDDVVEELNHRAAIEEAFSAALHDAINAPKGVVPASAEPFYDTGRYQSSRPGPVAA